MRRLVVDTSVWVSGLLRGKISRRFISEFLNNKFSLIISTDLLNELTLTICKPKLMPLIIKSESMALIAFIKANASTVEPVKRLNICRDPKDDKFLECSLAARADGIITWDEDLLVLDPFRNIEIITPREYLKRLAD